jgi:hypothetical protein
MSRRARRGVARVAAPIAAVALLAAACGSDDDHGGAIGTAPTTAGSTTATGVGPSTTGGGGVGPAATRGDGGSDRPGVATSVSPATSVRTDGAPGTLAALILRPAESREIVVDVAAQDGAAPREATLDHVTAVLRSVTGKAVSVERRGLPGGAQPWDRASLDAARGAGDEQRRGGAAVVRLLFVHGTYGGDDSILGVAYRGDTAAVFVDGVDAAGGLLTGSGPLEDAVSLHEVGHLLGLVDLVVPTGRADPSHPGHSTNRESVMYWAVESSLVGDVLSGGPPRDLDAADRADLERIRRG